MANGGLLTTTELAAVFSEEIAAMGGTVKEVFDDGLRLLARSVLNATTEVQPGDRLRAGIALRSTGECVSVHPYVLRQVCTNGSIMAQSFESRSFDLNDFESTDAATVGIATAIRLCGGPEAFITATDRMRTALETQADLAIMLMPMLDRLPGIATAGIVHEVIGRFLAGDDRSRYGLFNAVTSVARDTKEPETRWRLEEFGGGLIVGSPAPRRPTFDRAAARDLIAV